MEFPTVQMFVLVVVTFLVTEGLKSLSKLAGADLSGYGSAIVAAVVALLIGLFQTVLVPLMPANVLALVEPAAALLVAILSSFGVHATVKRFSVE
jgi:hypothetical protein